MSVSESGSEQMSLAELDTYRAMLVRCRETVVAASEKAIREMMAQNAVAVARIGGGLAALEPRPGETASEHRRRIVVALACG
jgi:hypothetical protein